MTYTVVDLFAGAGGLSYGLDRACRRRGLTPGEDVELHAINHSAEAIETHRRNIEWAHHYHAKIEALHPPEVADPDSVKVVSGGPSCTHHSNARAGKPKKEQMRASAWNVLKWVEHLQPDHVLLENVPEFRTWDAVEDGDRDGGIFELFLEFFERFGYTVNHRVLNCANYGDATSRERLFIVASRTHRPTFPAPTHAEDPGDDDDRDPWRPAIEVLDLDDLGTSIWTRDLEHSRVTPPANNTMRRIAKGIRRHCPARYWPLADALEGFGTQKNRDDGLDVTLLDELRDNIVPLTEAGAVADAVDEPFLVRVPDGHAVLADPFVLRQQSGGVPCPLLDDPLPTVATRGAMGLTSPLGRPLVKPRNGASGGLHSNAVYQPEDRPLHVITAKNTDGHLVTPRAGTLDQRCEPWLDDFQGPPDALDEPLSTQPASERFALCVPEAWPWGIDVRYRMLKPAELKKAQGFPADYDIAGDSKGVRTEQLGNAVPVHTATELFDHLLGIEDPSLSTYGGGLTDDPDVDVPEYNEVVGDD